MSQGPDRLGLSESEAVVLWAVARFGGGEELVGGLEPAAAEALAPKARALNAMGAGAREELTRGWLAEDTAGESVPGAMARISLSRQRRLIPTLGERWSSVAARAVEGERAGAGDEATAEVAARIALEPLLHGPHRLRMELVGGEGQGAFDPAWLLRQDTRGTQAALTRVGVAMTAQVVAGLGRRQQARFVGALGEREQRWMIQDLREEREVDGEVVERTREVLVRAQRDEPGWPEVFEAVGLYFVVCAASRRHGRRLRRWIQRCRPERARAIEAAWSAHARGSHPWLDAPTQRALDGLVGALDRDVFGTHGGA
jgi:hypothetical protein